MNFYVRVDRTSINGARAVCEEGDAEYSGEFNRPNPYASYATSLEASISAQDLKF